MSTSESRVSVADVLPSLLFSTGFWMVLTALPIGLVVLLEEHFQFHSDRHWATIAAVVMTVTVATIGGIFLAIAILIFKRQAQKTAAILK
jgi:hypothetical protein